MTVFWQVLITLAALSGLAFVVTYAVLAPWWRSAVGWNLMTMAGALTVAFGMIATRAWVGPLPLWVWVVVVLLITVALIQRTVLLVVEHRRARRALTLKRQA
jgi:uncharacterized membrane protein HdeD (DUF308 family)